MELPRIGRRLAMGTIAMGLGLLILAFLNSHGLLQDFSVYEESDSVRITGIVIDGKTGKPLSKAKLGGMPDDWTITVTNDAGEFAVDYESSPDWLETIIEKMIFIYA